MKDGTKHMQSNNLFIDAIIMLCDTDCVAPQNAVAHGHVVTGT